MFRRILGKVVLCSLPKGKERRAKNYLLSVDLSDSGVSDFLLSDFFP